MNSEAWRGVYLGGPAKQGASMSQQVAYQNQLGGLSAVDEAEFCDILQCRRRLPSEDGHGPDEAISINDQ